MRRRAFPIIRDPSTPGWTSCSVRSITNRDGSYLSQSAPAHYLATRPYIANHACISELCNVALRATQLFCMHIRNVKIGLVWPDRRNTIWCQPGTTLLFSVRYHHTWTRSLTACNTRKYARPWWSERILRESGRLASGKRHGKFNASLLSDYFWMSAAGVYLLDNPTSKISTHASWWAQHSEKSHKSRVTLKRALVLNGSNAYSVSLALSTFYRTFK